MSAPFDLGPVLDNVQYEAAFRVLLKATERHASQQENLREGLAETPARAAKAWKHWTGGNDIDPAALLKTFEDGAQGYNQMVVITDIPVYSHCEHHLAPIFGRACVGYLPQGRIVGLSKIHRVVDAFARRLQTQERMTAQIANCIHTGLNAQGCGVIMRCRHMCIESRGVAQQGTVTTTSAMLGVLFDDATARNEFMSLAKFEATI